MGYFIDFYLMQAAEFEVGRALAASPEVGRVALEHLAEEIAEHRAWLEPGLALALRDYMFLACAGEARHCRNAPGKEDDDSTLGRQAVYSGLVSRFAPTQESFMALAELFEKGKFGAAYGGIPWALIARHGAAYYSAMSDVVFIDTAASLAHNNGTMFNKSEASEFIPFDLGRYEHLRGFLDVQHLAHSLLDVYISSSYRVEGKFYEHGFHTYRNDPDESIANLMTRRGLTIAKKAAALIYGGGTLKHGNWLATVKPTRTYDYDEPSYVTPEWGPRKWRFSPRLYTAEKVPVVQSWLPFCNDSGVYDFCEQCAPLLQDRPWRTITFGTNAVRIRGGVESYYDDDDNKVEFNPFAGAYILEVGHAHATN